MLKLKVVTPTHILRDELVDNVSVPTTAGMITVLNKHVPIVSTIRHGEMTIRKEGTGVGYAVHSGVVNVRPHKDGLTEVVILLDEVEELDPHDEEVRRKALARAKEVATEKADDVDFGEFESLIERELLKVKFRYNKKRL